MIVNTQKMLLLNVGVCYNYVCYVPLCVGSLKEKAGIQLECIPEKWDTNSSISGKCFT